MRTAELEDKILLSEEDREDHQQAPDLYAMYAKPQGRVCILLSCHSGDPLI